MITLEDGRLHAAPTKIRMPKKMKLQNKAPRVTTGQNHAERQSLSGIGILDDFAPSLNQEIGNYSELPENIQEAGRILAMGIIRLQRKQSQKISDNIEEYYVEGGQEKHE